MKNIYPVPSFGYDPNALILPLFELGYYAILVKIKIHSADRDGKTFRSLTKNLNIINKTLNQLRMGVMPNTQLSITVDFIAKCLQEYRDEKINNREIVSKIANFILNLEAKIDEEPVCGWCTIGATCAIWDTQDDKSDFRKALPVADHIRKIILKNDDKLVRNLLEQSPAKSETAFNLVSAWIRTHTFTLWEPAATNKDKDKFNGRELTPTEYTVLAILRVIAYKQDKGLTVDKLCAYCGTYTARNSLTELRRYPETRNFISAKAPVKFIRPAPEPPNHDKYLKMIKQNSK